MLNEHFKEEINLVPSKFLLSKFTGLHKVFPTFLVPTSNDDSRIKEISQLHYLSLAAVISTIYPSQVVNLYCVKTSKTCLLSVNNNREIFNL